MKYRPIAILMFLFVGAFAFGQAPGLDETKLKAEFEGKIISLHHFYEERFQRFDVDGAAKEDYPTCPWTMCGKLNIDKVSLSKNKLKVEGRRIWVLFKGEPRQISYANSPELVEISIELGEGPDRDKRLSSAFSKIFLVGQQKFEDDLPEFWKPLFRVKPEVSPAAIAPTLKPAANSTPVPPTEDAAVAEKPKVPATSQKMKLPDKVRVSQGVTAGLLIHKVTPSYPQTARATHISGTVVMAALIGKEGKIENLYVLKPVGAGLDEAAYEAVKQWRYRPYLFQGQPVQVDTQITVNFELRR